MKEQDSTKMEFLLTLNDNIVVQRFFNVRGYNPKAKNSVELYNFILKLVNRQFVIEFLMENFFHQKFVIPLTQDHF
jgi:hypothetical protein